MGALLVADAGAVAVGAGPVITAVPAGQGSTFTVRGTSVAANVNLVGLAGKSAAASMVRVRSTYLSDNVQGIRYNIGINGDDLIGGPPYQSLQPQDQMTVEVDGTAADEVGVLLSSYYTDLSGASPTLHMPADLSSQMDYVTTWVVDAAASATIGGWNNTIVTADYDESKANRWYAVLGYVCDVAVLGVALNGADTSNFNIGGPGVIEPRFTKRYFADLSLQLGQPCIPCFQTPNKGNTNVAVVDNAASTAVNVTLVVAVMKAGATL